MIIPKITMDVDLRFISSTPPWWVFDFGPYAIAVRHAGEYTTIDFELRIDGKRYGFCNYNCGRFWTISLPGWNQEPWKVDQDD